MKIFEIPFILLILCIHLSFDGSSQSGDLQAFHLFDHSGQTAEFQELISRAEASDVIFIGELHDDPIAHWLQKRVLDSLIESTDCKVLLGMEMLERDQQLILDEYLNGLITEQYYLDHMRHWPNYETDYHPLVQQAKESEVPVFATNIPRRYANGIYRSGLLYLDSLSDRAKDWVPRPFQKPDTSLQSYASLLEMGGAHGGSEHLLYAQAVKDAAMAEVIVKQSSQNSCFLHLNGSYHSDYKEGIAWYLKQLDNDLEVLTVTTVRQVDIRHLEDQQIGRADFILCVPKDMTKTH